MEDNETKDGLEMFWNEKPKELPSILSGFTPAPDALIKKYSYVTALVWGRIWRYAQGPHGACTAALDTVATELGMSMRTIIRHIEPLERDGFIKDLTPTRKNKPHIYADTGKLRIRISVDVTMTESHSAMTESQSEGDRESHEESIKKEKKKNLKSGGTPANPPKSAEPKASDIPELVLYRGIVEHWPKRAQRGLVIDAVRKIAQRLGRDVTADDLTPWWLAWMKVSQNEWSLTWLDWAIAGAVLPFGSRPGVTPPAVPAPVYSQADRELGELLRQQRLSP